MNWNIMASILFIVVIAIELYQIFGLRQYTWSDYLTIILIAAALILILKGELSSKA